MEEIRHKTVFDTNQQQLANVYAKALLGAGEKSGKLGQLIEELDAVVGAIDQLPKLKSTLESPRVDAGSKAALIDKCFGSRVSKDLAHFLKIVANKGRFDCLPAMLGSARRMYDEMSGRVEATVTTAESIDEQVRQQISDRLSGALGKAVNLTASVDPGIIGGMVVRVGDTVYDGSVVSQLAQVRSQTIKRATDVIRASIDRFTSS
jgi:F-type H+-transporting ATPase subunit delta